MIGKVAADHSHKWVLKEAQEQEANLLSSWNNPADSVYISSLLFSNYYCFLFLWDIIITYCYLPFFLSFILSLSFSGHQWQCHITVSDMERERGRENVWTLNLRAYIYQLMICNNGVKIFSIKCTPYIYIYCIEWGYVLCITHISIYYELIFYFSKSGQPIITI